MKLERIIQCQNDLGEGPLWSPAENALYWLDINRAKIQRLEHASGDVKVFDMPFKVTALALRKSGGFVCATERGFHFWDGASSDLKYIYHPEPDKTGARFNDGKVDRAGRFWAGTMDPRDASSALYRLDPGRSVHLMEHGITISNGIGWSPDNRRMFYVDTLHYVIYDYRFDLETGEISNRRVFVRVKPDFGVPDGLTVDAQCGIWVAFYDGWKLVHYLPDGEIDQIIKLPVARPTCPAFGGPDLDELYITTAIDGLPPEQLKDQPMAGDLFMLKPGMKGLPEPKFTG